MTQAEKDHNALKQMAAIAKVFEPTVVLSVQDLKTMIRLCVEAMEKGYSDTHPISYSQTLHEAKKMLATFENEVGE